jgi:hypothetical protein
MLWGISPKWVGQMTHGKFFGRWFKHKTLSISILKAKNGSGTESADGIDVGFAPGVRSHQCHSLERA